MLPWARAHPRALPIRPTPHLRGRLRAALGLRLRRRYEACTSIGAHDRALDVFREQSELRKSLFAPRFTPVSFTHLLLAGVEGGQMGRLGGVLAEMERVGCLPAVGTCAKLLGAALEQGELEVAEQVLALTRRAGHAPDRLLLDELEAEKQARRLDGGEGARALLAHGGAGQRGHRRPPQPAGRRKAVGK